MVAVVPRPVRNTPCFQTEAGKLVERARYSAYGIPTAFPAGDCDYDGDWDASDSTDISSNYTPRSAYAVRRDADLDGDVDAADVTHANSITGGYQTLGRDVLTSAAVRNRIGYAGYQYDPTFSGLDRHLFHVRHRVYDAELGRWTRRDPLPSASYTYADSQPLDNIDPSGLVPSAAIDWVWNAFIGPRPTDKTFPGVPGVWGKEPAKAPGAFYYRTDSDSTGSYWNRSSFRAQAMGHFDSMGVGEYGLWSTFPAPGATLGVSERYDPSTGTVSTAPGKFAKLNASGNHFAPCASEQHLDIKACYGFLPTILPIVPIPGTPSLPPMPGLPGGWPGTPWKIIPNPGSAYMANHTCISMKLDLIAYVAGIDTLGIDIQLEHSVFPDFEFAIAIGGQPPIVRKYTSTYNTPGHYSSKAHTSIQTTVSGVPTTNLCE